MPLRRRWTPMRRRDLLSALVAMAALAGAPRRAAAAQLHAKASVERSLMSGDIDIFAYVDVPAVDVRLVWSVLTDYNHLAQFVPDMYESRVVSRPGAPIRVYQRGQKSWLLLGVPLELVLQMDESPPARIRFHLVSGTLNNMYGEWQISPRGNGVRVGYLAHIEPGLLSPRVPGDSLLIEADIEHMLEAVGGEILRRKAAGAWG
jgi:Polyketide cyclase / dehydrase and lipid transport